jgi:hypothetical protein
MGAIDGDRLKAFLNDSEKTLKGINDDRESWGIFIRAIDAVFRITCNAIDRMSTLETRGED